MSRRIIKASLENIERCHVLVDTCFFIDYLLAVRNRDAEDYDFLVKTLYEQHNVLVTVFPVALEFLKGSNLLEDFRKKKKFFDDLISHVLPVMPKTIEDAQFMTILYRQKGKDISSTDFVLAAALSQYSSSGMLLLTNDHGDFPTKIFDRQCVVPLEHQKGGVETYALFRHSPDKDIQIFSDLIESDKKMKLAQTPR